MFKLLNWINLQEIITVRNDCLYWTYAFKKEMSYLPSGVYRVFLNKLSLNDATRFTWKVKLSP
jgi:hypothetical protein